MPNLDGTEGHSEHILFGTNVDMSDKVPTTSDSTVEGGGVVSTEEMATEAKQAGERVEVAQLGEGEKEEAAEGEKEEAAPLGEGEKEESAQLVEGEKEEAALGEVESEGKPKVEEAAQD